MHDSLEFSVAYLQRQPESAARVLRSMKAADAAALLQALPAGLAANTLARIGPLAAVRVVRALSAADAASMLAELPEQDTAALLRLLDDTERGQVFENLPESIRRDVAGSLAYPADTVGALMTTSIVTLEPTDSVGTALEALRHSRQSDVDAVFIASSEREPLGAVNAVTLLASPGKARLADVSDTSLPVVPARATPAAVADFDSWRFSRALPVVNRRRELVGALTYRALRQYIDPRRMPSNARSTSILLPMSEDLVDSVVGIWDLLQGSAPRRGDSE